MNNRTLMRVMVALLVLVISFGVAQSALADLKATAVFSALSDENPPKYRNSLVYLQLDGEETHVIHELGFDNDDYYYNPADETDPNNDTVIWNMCQAIQGNVPHTDCPTDLSTDPNDPNNEWETFAGVMELGIPREDVGNGALAFASSAFWKLIDCDLDGDDDFDVNDLDVNTLVNPPVILAPWTSDPTHFQVLSIDHLRACGNNTCSTELVTTIFLDLDLDNSDALEQCPAGTDPNTNAGTACEVPASGAVCFFAEIFTEYYNPGDPVWTGNPQARITAGGGDKTVNFRVFGPSAITLENLVAQSPGSIHPFVWLTIAVLLTGIAFVLIRESRRQTRELFVHKDE